MNKKMLKKLFALVFAFILTFTNFTTVGSFMVESIAANINLETQNTKVEKANVEFDAYFLEEGEIKHSREFGAESDAKIYLKVKVTDGYLANGTIKMKEANFNVKKIDSSSVYVQSIDSKTNTIILNQIDKGESVILEIPIDINTDSNFALQNIDKITDVVLSGVYVNNKAEEKEISKLINVNAKLTSEAKSNLEEEITKFVQYEINDEKRVALELTIKSSVENNVLPVKETNLEIEIPKINNIEPKEIAVSAKSLNATNGEGTKIFSNEEYNYENGKVTLVIKNEEKDGLVSWRKDVQDEIIVACIYEQTEKLDYVEIETKASNKIYLYDSNNTNVSRNIRKSQTYSEQIGEAITYGISTSVSKLQKGYMLIPEADDTKYVENISVNIVDKDLADSITLDSKTNYIDEKDKKHTANQKYLSTKISKDNFISMLGDNGYIKIYNNEGNIITTLDKDNLEYTYQAETTYIKLETSKPITEGIINIQNERGIKPLEYTKNQEELFIKMNTVLNGAVLLNNAKTMIGQNEIEIMLENPSEQAVLELNRNNLSTVVVNENVEIRATLKTTDASTVLFKNPSIEIVLPKYITDISIKKVSLLYDEELVVLNTTKNRKNGNISITITLSGEQTAFNKEAVADGATIVIESDITVDELTPTLAENIVMNVKNEATNKTITETADIKFVAPVGLATINQISNFNDENGTVTSISGKAEIGEIQIETAARTAKIKMTIINNNKNECENVVILGRIPFAGDELGSTFTAKMVNGIKTETDSVKDKFKTYYSKNGEATKDINNTENGWTEGVSDLSDIKSYMIVINNKNLKVGDTISFSFDIEIPENLQYDESAYEAYTVYYNKVEGNKVLETVKATAAGITTGEGPDLKVELKSDVQDKAELEEGELVTYTAKITNNKNVKQDGVSLVIEMSDNVYYKSKTGTNSSNGNIQYVTIPVGEIEANETKEIEFKLGVGEFIETKTSKSSGNIKFYDENGKEIEQPKDEFNTELTLKDFNNDEETYKKYIEAKEEYLADKKAREDVLNFDINTNKIKVKAVVKAQGFEKQFESNERVNTIIKKDSEPKIIMSINTSYDTTLRKGNMMEYGLTIRKNVSTSLSNVVVTCTIPEGLIFYEATNNGIYNEENKTVTWTFDTMEVTKFITLRCIAEELPSGVYQKEIPLSFNAKCDENERKFTSSELTVNVVGEKNSEPQTDNVSKRGITNQKVPEENVENNETDTQNTQNVTNTTYEVSGIVWVDLNRNGQRDEDEELKPDIDTLLIDSQTNDVFGRTKTDENGVYTFEGVEKKQYIIAFSYDTLEYDLSTYQVEGVDAKINSDAINMILNVDNKVSKYAATDTIFVSSNIDNIDLGLVISKKFDLELRKSVAFIQTSNANGTESYMFNKSEIAKIEIPEKEIDGTVVAITYNFTIENTGAIAGYANKIVDYIPIDLSFSSNLNPEWYQDTDGNIYNISLANRIINPGEKVELSLILTKTMTEENTGVVNNSAEIYEASNDYGILDLDSTPANRATVEDDYSTADAIITIKTGGPVAYTTIGIIVFAIFGLGTYFIKRKVLPRI